MILHARTDETLLPIAGRASWPLPLPTPRAAACVAACAPLVALGALAPPAAIVGLLLLAAVLVLILVDFMRAPVGRQLAAVRRSGLVLTVGEEEELEVEIWVRGPRAEGRGPLVRVVDALPDGIDEVRPAEPARLSGGRRRFSTVVRATRRGRHRLTRIDIRAAGPLGLAERETRVDLPLEVRVHPGIRGIKGTRRLLRRALRSEMGSRRVRRRGEGTAFESLAEYVPGEDLRKVDWKASAKRAKLITRRYEVERSQNLVVLLDGGRWMTAEVNGLTRYDHVLNATLLLARVANLRQDRVGMLAFAEDVQAFVPPTPGRAAEERILEAVYEIEPELVEPDYGRALRYLALHHRKRSLIVLFTDVLSREASRIVIDEFARLRRRHLLLIVTLRDPAVDALATATPTNRSAAYLQAAAEELRLEREHALAALRSRGVHVLDVTPEELGPGVVDRYLELKSAQLL